MLTMLVSITADEKRYEMQASIERNHTVIMTLRLYGTVINESVWLEYFVAGSL